MKKIGNMTVLDHSDFSETKRQKKEREEAMVKSIAANGDYISKPAVPVKVAR